jgi:hypothetical protein
LRNLREQASAREGGARCAIDAQREALDPCVEDHATRGDDMYVNQGMLLGTLMLFAIGCADLGGGPPDSDEGEWLAFHGAGNALTDIGAPGRSGPAYISYDQEAVLLVGVDFDGTLEVAARSATRGTTTSLMVLWAVRDQVIDPVNAARAGALYLEHIDAIYTAPRDRIFDWNFGVWHSAWAISNLYRNGSAEVKAALQDAYDDAVTRPATLERFVDVATRHVNGRRPLMGDIHAGGRALAHRTLVIPGNPDYLQSPDDYE